MRGATSAFLDRLVAEAAQPVKPLSVSFGPSTGPDWSVSVMVGEVETPEPGHTRNADRRFREAGR